MYIYNTYYIHTIYSLTLKNNWWFAQDFLEWLSSATIPVICWDLDDSIGWEYMKSVYLRFVMVLRFHHSAVIQGLRLSFSACLVSQRHEDLTRPFKTQPGFLAKGDSTMMLHKDDGASKTPAIFWGFPKSLGIPKSPEVSKGFNFGWNMEVFPILGPSRIVSECFWHISWVRRFFGGQISLVSKAGHFWMAWPQWKPNRPSSLYWLVYRDFPIGLLESPIYWVV